MFISELKNLLSKYHLLKHPFYQAWNAGALDREMLRYYAVQYFKNVDAFPRYVSGIHSQCPSKEDRKILLENLIDEERGEADHPELWLRFAESLGENREDVQNAELSPAAKALIDGFFNLIRSSYASGLGALFAYEQQVPEVATSKIDGLKNFYGYEDDNEGLRFFKVHTAADEWHSEEVGNLLKKLDDDEKIEAKDSAMKAGKLLWDFLSDIYNYKNGIGNGSNC